MLSKKVGEEVSQEGNTELKASNGPEKAVKLGTAPFLTPESHRLAV